jgi:hypothetical protein
MQCSIPTKNLQAHLPGMQLQIAEFPRDEELVQDLLLESDLLVLKNAGIDRVDFCDELLNISVEYCSSSAIALIATHDHLATGVGLVKVVPKSHCLIPYAFARGGANGVDAFECLLGFVIGLCARYVCNRIYLPAIPHADGMYELAVGAGFRTLQDDAWITGMNSQLDEAISLYLDVPIIHLH